MFEDLKAELGKSEGVVRSAFGDVKAATGKQKTQVQTLDAELLGPFDRLVAAATKAETTVRSRLAEVRTAVERLIT